jgi:hypothetical protein
MRKKKVQLAIYSVFGQIEQAAANHMLREGRGTRIEFKDIPEGVRYNDKKVPAAFAIVLRGPEIREYANLCDALKA